MSTLPPPPPAPPPPPPPSPHRPGGWPSGIPATPPSSGMATAALVCGIVGLLMCWAFVPSAVALVLGLVAASRAKETSDPRAGLGRARAGWIMGAIGVTLFALFIIGTIADLDEQSGRRLHSTALVTFEPSGV